LLTPKHLRLIKAALQYVDEELSPHGPAAYKPYMTGETVTPDEVATLRNLLNRCELKYLQGPPDSGELEAGRLLDAAEESAPDLMTVLFFPSKPEPPVTTPPSAPPA